MSEDALDRPRGVRAGEELPREPLRAWLAERLGLPAEASLEIEQFPSGFSNLTYLVRIGEREMVLRRPPFGSNVKTAHDMGREFRILEALSKAWPKAPRPLGQCESPDVLGAPFYVMERVRGVILRGVPLKGLALDAAAMRRLSEALLDGLAELHALDYAGCGLADLGKPEGYAARQVRGWSERYRNAATDEVAALDESAAWLLAHVPSAGAAALVHNDYKYDNLVFDAELNGIVAVLDWEMATIGDPLFDLGTTLGYWLDPDDPQPWQETGLLGLTALPGNLSRAGLVERYVARRGGGAFDPVFYYVYGLFKIAVIVQQIYARYRKGLTKDARFAPLGAVVRACGEQARLAIAKGRIDRLSA